jgi:hypothetical protein
VGIWRVRVRLGHALDLRRPLVGASLDLPGDPAWILDTEHTRNVAAEARYLLGADGLVVASAAFLDHPDRWRIVVFPTSVEAAYDAIEVTGQVGRCRWADPGGRPVPVQCVADPRRLVEVGPAA